jgi:hypothetical protein
MNRNSSLCRSVYLAAALAVGAVCVIAAQAPVQLETQRVDVTTLAPRQQRVSILVKPADIMTGHLEAANFHVREDGNSVRDLRVDEVRLGAAAVILVDQSGEMTGTLGELAWQIARQSVAGFETPADRVAVMSFARHSDVRPDFTDQSTAVEPHSLSAANGLGSASCAFDALKAAVGAVADSPLDLRAVLLVAGPSGSTPGCGSAGPETAIDVARRAGVAVYTFSLAPEDDPRNAQLARLAAQTGGLHATIEPSGGASQIQAALTRIKRRVRLEYMSQAAPGNHRLDIAYSQRSSRLVGSTSFDVAPPQAAAAPPSAITGRPDQPLSAEEVPGARQLIQAAHQQSQAQDTAQAAARPTSPVLSLAVPATLVLLLLKRRRRRRQRISQSGTGAASEAFVDIGPVRQVPAHDELLGSQQGKYRILEVAGLGGQAVVYRALDVSLGREVALKVLRTGLESGAEVLRRARLQALLQHPHVVVVHEVAEVAGRPAVAMEYIGGPTLSAVIRLRGAVPPGQLSEWLQELAGALSYAHRQGVVHGDLKPANILLTPSGRVKLSDFGVATWEGSSDWARVGTPGYVAPEVVEGGQPDERSDVYALGRVLYEALTGQILGSGSGVVMHWEEVRPSALADVLRDATAADPSERLPSVAATLARFTECLGGGSGSPAPSVEGAVNHAPVLVGSAWQAAPYPNGHAGPPDEEWTRSLDAGAPETSAGLVAAVAAATDEQPSGAEGGEGMCAELPGPDPRPPTAGAGAANGDWPPSGSPAAPLTPSQGEGPTASGAMPAGNAVVPGHEHAAVQSGEAVRWQSSGSGAAGLQPGGLPDRQAGWQAPGEPPTTVPDSDAGGPNQSTPEFRLTLDDDEQVFTL